jgi:hypothetical protein
MMTDAEIKLFTDHVNADRDPPASAVGVIASMVAVIEHHSDQETAIHALRHLADEIEKRAVERVSTRRQ